MQSFNQQAKTYNHYAAAQRLAAALLVRELPLAEPLRILDLGSGTGIMTKQLRNLYPNAHITALDSSRLMLDQAQPYADHCLVQSIESYDNSDYDLIVSSLAFQWVQNPEQILERYLKTKFCGIIVTKDSFPEWGYPMARSHLPDAHQFDRLNLIKKVVDRSITYKNKAAFLHSLKYTGAYKAAPSYKPMPVRQMRDLLNEEEPFTVTWKFLILCN